MQIHGFQKTTLLDYPGKVACTIFFGGCNFRCPFCHNGNLVLCADKVPTISEEEIFSHLKKRATILEGVCITGGEPCLQPQLIPFIRRLRTLGLSIKLDTNGYYPDVLISLVKEGLIDYVAMDIKQCPEKYNFISQMHDFDIAGIRQSVSFLLEGNIPYEFRTTVVKELHNFDDFKEIGLWIAGADSYFLQSYKDSNQVITSGFSSCSYQELKDIQSLLLPFVPNIEIRGVDEA